MENYGVRVKGQSKKGYMAQLRGRPTCSLTVSSHKISPITRPEVITGIFDHTRPDRIQHYLTEAGQQEPVFLHNAGLEAAFKHSSTAGKGVVEMTHVEAPQKKTSLNERVISGDQESLKLTA